MEIPDEIRNILWKRVIRATKILLNKQGLNNIANAIDKLTADPTIQDSFIISVKRGRIRFVNEYHETASSIKDIISSRDDLFESEDVLGSIFMIVAQPGSYFPEAHEKLVAALEGSVLDSIDHSLWCAAENGLLSCIAKELLSLPGTSGLRDIYSLQIQQANALSLHVIAEMTQAQTEQLKSFSSHILDTRRSVDLLSGPVSTPRRKPFHNVPRPDYTRLVGRDEELSRLRNLLRFDDRVFQVALVGVGGVGKSALAQAIALELIERYDTMDEKDRFDCIVWASAKEEVLTPYGREPASASSIGTYTLEHVYARLAAVLELETITTTQPSHQGDIVRTVLQNQRCLLIIDNFESVADPRIKPFLRELPAPTKAIITSREGYDVADVLRLYGLAPDAAVELANDEAQRHGLVLTDDQHDQIISVTHGIPLAIRLGIARIATGETFQAVIRWLGDADGDITDYCVAGQVQLAWNRNSYARSILLACSLFSMDSGASPDSLRYVTDISRHDRDTAITVLLRLQLLQVEHPDRYRMLPIVQRFARTQFISPDAGDKELIERWLLWHLELIRQVTGGELDVGGDKILDTEYANVVNAARWCFEAKRWTDLYELASRSWGYAYTHSLFIDRTQSSNRVADFDELLTMAMTAAQSMGDDIKVGRVDLQRARLQLIQRGPQSENLTQLLDSAIDKAITSESNADILVALYTKGYVMFRRGELTAAQKIADDLMRRAQTNSDDQFAFWAYYRTSEVQVAREQFGDALASLRIAEDHAKLLGSARLRAHILHRRSAVLIAQGDGENAIPLLFEALGLDRQRGEIRYMANDMYSLATIYAGMPGRMNDTISLAKDAHAFYARLGMTEELKKTEKLLNELQV